MDKKTRNWLLEHHKEAYRFQLERSDKIRDRVSFLSGLLTLLGSAIFYVILNYPHAWRDWCSLLFYVPVGFSVVLFLVAVWQILYCLGWGFRYSYILTPGQLQEYTKSLASYAAAVPEDKVDVLDDVKTHLMDRYCEGATHNLEVNTRRTNVLLRATQISILSFGLLLLSLPSFFVERGRQEAAPTKVIVSEPIRITK
jgi:hypothetical protein